MDRVLYWVRRIPIAVGMRQVLREGYGIAGLRADLWAGITVGIVAVPLSMALAIASGVAPRHGLYTAMVAGALTALLGGARLNVTGPTAAFVVILQPIAAHYGTGGLMVATFMAGIALLVMGLARMGRFIQFIPYPVTTGFTAGIAIVIASLQLKDLLGINLSGHPEQFTDRLIAVIDALPTVHGADFGLGLLTLALLILWPRLRTGIPGPLVALSVATLAGWLLGIWHPGWQPETIASRFSYSDDGAVIHGIKASLPSPAWPWSYPGPDGVISGFSLQMLRDLSGPALAIAMLAAIESLLCAVVVDGLAGTRHDPDAELVGLGIGNLVAPFLGGIAATGAVARSATGVRAGARSPMAAVIHAVFIAAALLSLAPLLNQLPMAALAALLLIVAWHMSELRRVVHILRRAPKSDIAVLLTCISLTVFVDMVVAVSVGVVLAALLFMRRMTEVSRVRLTRRTGSQDPELPPGVRIYHVSGPLFFGAADSAAQMIQQYEPDLKVVILDLSAVPAMDITGAVALETAVERLNARGIKVILAGVEGQARRVLIRAGLFGRRGKLRVTHDIAAALRLAGRSVSVQHAGQPGGQ